MKNIAVQGCTLSVSAAQLVTPPSSVVFCDGKGAYFGDITVSIAGYGSAGITDNNGAGSATLKGSALYVSSPEGSKDNMAVLEGDSVIVTVNGTSTKGQVVTPVSESVKVEIKSAGQTVVQGS